MRINLKYVVIPLLAVALYLALNFHFIFFDSWKPYPLKKIRWSLNNTFVGASKARSYEKLLANRSLREAGLGELLVSRGRMTEDQLDEIKARYGE